MTTTLIKGGKTWMDSLYCSLFGWFFSPSSCRSSKKMIEDVKNAKFLYGGVGKSKKSKNTTRKHKK